MANDNTKLQYIVELLTQGDTKKATEELKKLEAAGTGSTAAMGGLTKGFAALYAAIGGAAVIHQSINAFLEQERAIAKVNAALKATGEFTPELSEEMQKLADAMSTTSTFADEAILNVIAKLTAMGAKRQDVERLTRAVLDLSTLMDRDLNRATMAFSQALNGEVGALRQAGIAIDETKTSTEQFNDALRQIEAKAGGQAAEAVKTLGGRFEGLKKNVGEVKEALGGIILETLDPMIDRLSRLAKLVSDFASANKSSISGALQRGFVGATSAFIPGAGVIGPALLAAQQHGMFTDPGTGEAPLPKDLFNQTGSLAFMRNRGTVNTPGLSLKDDLSTLEDKAKLEDEILKTIQAEYDLRQRGEEQADRQSLQAMEDFRNGERVKQDLIDQTVLVVLDGQARERAEFEINHRKRLEQISEEKFETAEQYAEAIAAVQALEAAEKKRFEESQNGTTQLNQSLQKIYEHAQELAASGLVDALWSIADGSKSAGEAFRKFAADFGKEISQMILKAYALYAIKSLLGMVVGGSGGGSGGGFIGDINGGGSAAALAAAGGQWTAMAGGGMVNSPTLLPKFGVLAGEAGPELLTVLARPRFERINGVPAQIGSAGGARLAITSAAALAGATGGGGQGGTINLRVTLSPEVKAEVVETSLKNVIVEMHQDSALSRATKRLTA